MKRFCRYLLFSIIGILTLLLFAMHSSFIQEFCLKTALKTHFRNIQFVGFRGGASSITVDRIELRNENEAFTLSRLRLDWKPWQLLFKKTLYVKNLQLQLSIDIKHLPTASTVQTAGIGLPKNRQNNFSFLQPLQLPVKLHIDQADLQLKGHLPNCEIQRLQLDICQFTPNRTGTLEYALSAETPLQRTTLNLQTEGTFRAQIDERGIFNAFFLNGKLHLKNGDKKIPPLTYDGSVLRTQPYPKERLQLILRCGQANEITLSGETLKTADHWVDFSAQALFDHTLPQLFDIPGIPTLSVLSEGTFGLHRKTNRWQNRLYLSVWAKDFDMQTEMLPTLALKARLEAESDAHRIDLQQYSLQLKEKGTEHLFFTAHSLQPLTYDFRNGFQYASKKNAQLLTVACYEVPLEIFNPYLQTYGYRLQSSLDGGRITVSWNETTKQFHLDTPEAIVVKIKKLQKEEMAIVSDVQGKLRGYCSIHRNGSALQYKGDLTVTDAQHIPFFTFSSEGTYQSKPNETQFSSDGTLHFDYRSAQNGLNLTPFCWRIHPDLNVDATYQLSKETKKNKNTWVVRDFKADIGSAATEQTWTSVRFNHPLTITDNAFISEKSKPFADVHIQGLPLNIIQHPDVDIKGTLFSEGTLSTQQSALLWRSTSGETATDVQASFKQQPMLDLSRVASGDIIARLHLKEGLSVDINELQVYAPQQSDPLFKTRLQCRWKERQLMATKGQYDILLDALGLQPFALSYPGVFGTLSGNWKWNEDKKTVHSSLNASCTDLPFSVNLQANYTQQPDTTHVLDGELELKHADHVNDLSFQQRLDANKHLDGRITSRQIFLQDMIGLGIGIQKLMSSLPKKALSSDSSDKVPIRNNGNTAHTFQGTCDFEFQSVADLEMNDLLGRFEWDPKQLNLELSKGTFCQGSLEGNGTFTLPTNDLSCNLSAKNINLRRLWKLPEALQYSLAPYGKLEGNGSCSLELSGKSSDPQTLNGRLFIQAADGTFRTKFSNTGRALSDATTLFGALTGSTIPGAGTVGFLSSYASSIPFSNFTLDVERFKSKPITFSANARNSDLAVDLKGSVETRSFVNWKQQAFICDLQFRAPTDSPFANYFSFNPQKTDKNGYAEGPNCTIDGTLGKPNYLALTQLLAQPPPLPAPDSVEPKSQPSRQDVLQDLLKQSPVKRLFDLF